MEHGTTDRDADIARQRLQLKTRHALKLTELMQQRGDLRGVNALADLAYDSVRWSA